MNNSLKFFGPCSLGLRHSSRILSSQSNVPNFQGPMFPSSRTPRSMFPSSRTPHVQCSQTYLQWSYVLEAKLTISRVICPQGPHIPNIPRCQLFLIVWGLCMCYLIWDLERWAVVSQVHSQIVFNEMPYLDEIHRESAEPTVNLDNQPRVDVWLILCDEIPPLWYQSGEREFVPWGHHWSCGRTKICQVNLEQSQLGISQMPKSGLRRNLQEAAAVTRTVSWWVGEWVFYSLLQILH